LIFYGRKSRRRFWEMVAAGDRRFIGGAGKHAFKTDGRYPVYSDGTGE
jgi:hypothetical protein